MPGTGNLGPQVLFIKDGHVSPQRNSFTGIHSSRLQSVQLLRIVRDQSNRFAAQVLQNADRIAVIT
ncbi:hypothetical protein D3C80_2077420 [compost metagenome]